MQLDEKLRDWTKKGHHKSRKYPELVPNMLGLVLLNYCIFHHLKHELPTQFQASTDSMEKFATSRVLANGILSEVKNTVHLHVAVLQIRLEPHYNN